MFYSNNYSQQPRFGDIVKGFIFTTPKMNKPIIEAPYNFEMSVDLPQYMVILTPCCSIKENIVTLTPLLEIPVVYYNNPKFRDDLTVINRLILPIDALPPEALAKKEPTEIAEIKAKPSSYTKAHEFIYEEHELLPKYKKAHGELGELNIGHYRIDFRCVYKMGFNCTEFKEFKILELSLNAREQLRKKISYYYARKPEEDVL